MSAINPKREALFYTLLVIVVLAVVLWVVGVLEIAKE
jgi:hypothetical protein